MLNQIQPHRTYIAQPASSWLDDYMDWSLYTSGDNACCRIKESDGSFCPSTDNVSNCTNCDIKELPVSSAL